jgi:hypothetical protein
MTVLRVCVALWLLLAAVPASAHLVGASIEKQIGDYLVDVGYNVLQPEPGQDIVFDLSLIRNAGRPDWEFADFNEVTLDARKENAAADLPRKSSTLQVPSPAYITYRFPEKGTYQLHVRFLHAGVVVAETSLPLPVGVGPAASGMKLLIAATVAVNAALALVLVLAYRPKPARA